MRKLTTLLLAGFLGLGVGGRALAAGDEGDTATDTGSTATDTGSGADTEAESAHAHKVVPMADLPKPVKNTLHREAKGGKVEQVRKETRKDGSEVYEAKIIKKGKGTEVEVNSDGMVVDRGKAQDLPKTQQPKTQQMEPEEKGTTE